MCVHCIDLRYMTKTKAMVNLAVGNALVELQFSLRTRTYTSWMWITFS